MKQQQQQQQNLQTLKLNLKLNNKKKPFNKQTNLKKSSGQKKKRKM